MLPYTYFPSAFATAVPTANADVSDVVTNINAAEIAHDEPRGYGDGACRKVRREWEEECRHEIRKCDEHDHREDCRRRVEEKFERKGYEDRGGREERERREHEQREREQREREKREREQRERQQREERERREREERERREHRGNGNLGY